MKIPAETLKLRTILFKLFLMVAKLFRSVADIEKRPQQRCRTTDPGVLVLIHYKLENTLLKKEQIMLEQITSNRVLNRIGARELSPEEVQHVAGGTTGCQGTSLHKNGPIVDVLCDPS